MYFIPQFQTPKTDTPPPKDTPEIETDETLDSHISPLGKAEEIRLRFPPWRRGAYYL